MPQGTIQSAHMLVTPHYTQIVGTGDFTKINVQAGDSGKLHPFPTDISTLMPFAFPFTQEENSILTVLTELETLEVVSSITTVSKFKNGTLSCVLDLDLS
jgi:hypothetical protein